MSGTDARTPHLDAGLDPGSPLGARLKARHVRVRAESPDTLILQNVPANRRFFNKAGTNLMVRRTRAQHPFLIAVDEDLAYTGADPVLTRAFAGGTTQQGWRIVFLDSRVNAQLAVIVEDALRAVGFDDEEPGWRPASAGIEPQVPPGVLARFGRDVEAATGPGTSAAREAVAAIATSLLAQHPRLPVIVGPPGIGKSHLIALVAARLPAVAAGVRVVRVDFGQLFMGTLLDSERENLLAAVLGEAAAEPNTVLALERLDLVRVDTRHGPAALASAVEDGARIVATLAAPSVAQFDPPLARHLHAVAVAALSIEDTCDVLRAALPRVAAHHGVRAAADHVRAIAERAATLSGHLPATALALADAACARARVDGCTDLDIAHVYIAACAFTEREER